MLVCVKAAPRLENRRDPILQVSVSRAPLRMVRHSLTTQFLILALNINKISWPEALDTNSNMEVWMCVMDNSVSKQGLLPLKVHAKKKQMRSRIAVRLTLE